MAILKSRGGTSVAAAVCFTIAGAIAQNALYQVAIVLSTMFVIGLPLAVR